MLARLAGCADVPGGQPVEHSASTRSRSRRTPTRSSRAIGAGTGLHPDFGSGTWDGGPIGIPYDVVDGTTDEGDGLSSSTPTRATPARIRSRRTSTIEGGSDRHALIVDTRTLQALRAVRAQAPATAGTPAPARSGACARTRCGPTAGRRPTPPGCPSSPGSPATTRSPRARSTTRSASPSSARARAYV